MYRFSEFNEIQPHNKYEFSVRTTVRPTQPLFSEGGGGLYLVTETNHFTATGNNSIPSHAFMVYSLTEHRHKSV